MSRNLCLDERLRCALLQFWDAVGIPPVPTTRHSTFLSVKARVARALLELSEFVGTPSGRQCIVLDEKISHADLAAMAGVARENASRVLSEWRRCNLVLTGISPRFILKDVAALEREINGAS